MAHTLTPEGGADLAPSAPHTLGAEGGASLSPAAPHTLGAEGGASLSPSAGYALLAEGGASLSPTAPAQIRGEGVPEPVGAAVMIRVEGAGEPSMNGTYIQAAAVNGEPSWVRSDQPGFPKIIYDPVSDGYWLHLVADSEGAYAAPRGETTNPAEATGWFVDNGTYAPVPTYTLGFVPPAPHTLGAAGGANLSPSAGPTLQAEGAGNLAPTQLPPREPEGGASLTPTAPPQLAAESIY